MCGIAGYVSEQLWDGDRMLSVIQHRGPDAHTSEIHEIEGKKVCLGHNRLSILDLSPKGNQPMSTHDGRISMAYNGEVYNFQTLKTIHFPSQPFDSGTDTEVILRLYEKYGLDALQHLNGDFAIALIDKHKKKLFLVRDRMGVKPLYYTINNGALFFSSEIKGILAAGIKAENNEEVLQQYFAFKYVPQQNTLFKGIYRLPPAHVLSYDIPSGEYSLHQYWRPQQQDKYKGMSYKEAQTHLYNLIEDATQKRLVSDVSVGTFFSGGLDSSIIAHFLKGKDEILHYCAGKEAKDLKKEGTTSDAQYAQLLAKQWNLNLEMINIGGEQLTKDMIRKTIHFTDDIIADGSQIPSYLITQKAAKKSTVILSGMGADELFLGYAGHLLIRMDQYIHSLPKIIRQSLLKQFAALQSGKGAFKAYKRYLQKLGSYAQFGAQRYAMYNIVGDVQSARQIFKTPDESVGEMFTHYFSEEEDPFESLKRFEWENFLIKNLHYTDRMSMANSVENRVPFLDHRIVEFAYNCPTQYKISKALSGKRILKDAFRKHLPKKLIDRRKAGFGMPLRSLLSTEEQVDQLLEMDFFNNFTTFSIEGIQKVIKEHITGRKDNSALIYALITYQEWYKMHLD